MPGDSPTTGERHRIEWLTVGLGMAIVAMFLATTWFHRSLPRPVAIVALAWAMAWWSSFQHELIHGHPFAQQRINDAIGRLSFVAWIPYDLYRELHLRHHRNELLTDPLEDPESYYRSGPEWQALPAWKQKLWWMNRTLLGRLTIGPWIAVATFLRNGAIDAWRGKPGTRRAWVRHLVLLVPVLVWAVVVCGVPAWQYGLSIWVGTSLMKLRSFAEHRWVPGPMSRSATVHAEWPFALLYLNNNLHHAHHAKPGIPWYGLPAASRAMGADAASAAGAGEYRGYREVARRYLFRPFCIPVHPTAPEAGEIISARMAAA